MSGYPERPDHRGGRGRPFCALGLKDSASVTMVEAGPAPGTPPPRWMLYDYLLPDECYYHYSDADTGLDLPQGRVTGGGSTVNSAAALRGQPWDFDGWAVPGWSWRDCLEGFRAIESDQQFGAADYHGADGPIPVTRLTPGPLDEALIALCARRGHPAAADHNAPGALGIGVWPTNRRGEGRWGTHAGVLPLVRPAVDARAAPGVRTLLFDGTRRVGPRSWRAGHSALRRSRRGVRGRVRSSLPSRTPASPGGDAAAGRDQPRVSPDGVGANLQDHPWCRLDVDVTDVIAIRPGRRAGPLRDELPGTTSRPRSSVVGPGCTSAPGHPGLVHRGAHRRRSAGARYAGPARRSRGPGPPFADGQDGGPDGGDRWRPRRGRSTMPPWPSVAADAARRITGERPGGWPAPTTTTCGDLRHGGNHSTRATGQARAGRAGRVRLSVVDSSIMPVIPRAKTNLASMMIGDRAAQGLGAGRVPSAS